MSLQVAKCQASREESAMGRIHGVGTELKRAKEVLVQRKCIFKNPSYTIKIIFSLLWVMNI